MKKILALVLTLVVGIALIGCGEDNTTIGVLIPGADHGFTGESVSHAIAGTERLAEENGYDFKVLTSSTVVEQSNQIEQLISEGVDVMVLWPHNGDELKSAAQQVLDAEIPLIIYDRLISDFDETAELMGDNFTIGEDMGTYFNEYFEDELALGEVHILEFKGDNSSVPTQRSDGFYETADDNFVTDQQYVTNWSKDTAQTQMETFLTTNSAADVAKVQAVFTHDAEVALGVLAALEGYSGEKEINIQLVSAVSAPKELLEKFDHYETLGFDQVTFSFSPAMVVDAIQLGIDILNGEDVSGMYLVPTEMVDNGNYEAFMEGDVYTYRYSIYE